MVAPPRRQLSTLGRAAFLLAMLPSLGTAQRAPTSATSSMQARVTILPAVDGRATAALELASFAGAEAAPQQLIEDFAIAASGATERPRLRLAAPDAAATVPAEDVGRAGPPVVRHLEWVEPDGGSRLVRYTVAVVS